VRLGAGGMLFSGAEEGAALGSTAPSDFFWLEPPLTDRRTDGQDMYCGLL